MDAVTPRLAIVQGGLVIQIAESYPEGWSPSEGVAIACGPHPQPGWLYDGEAFTAPPPPVPESVTPLQARRALRQAGMLAGLRQFLAASPEEVQEAWDYAIEVRRDDPMLAGMAKAFGIDEEALDDLFRLAATF